MLARIRNCQILKPIARRLPKLEPNEVFDELVFYDTMLYNKLSWVTLAIEVPGFNFRPIHEDNRSFPNDADLKIKFKDIQYEC